MTTAPLDDQHPATPVVHLSRRAALEAERAAGRCTKTTRPAEERRSTKAARAAEAHRSTEAARTADARRSSRVTRPAEPARASRTNPLRALDPLRSANRASRVTATSALAAFVLFAASATPAHAAGSGAVATSTLAPSVAGQDYAVTQVAALADPARDGFTVGGGSDGTPGTSVSFGGEVRSPFPGPVRMSSGFGYRSAPCGACSSLHQGLDFTPGLGTPIGAVAAGTVRVAGTYFNYGTAVVIDHVIDGRKVATLYGHMVPGSTPLKVGDTVEAGEFIGQVGNSGVSTGAHLHLEVLMDGVTPIDPEAWLEARIGRSLTA
ncbi:hypothetical protein Csp2054_12550 [Curtobacterium sp. 'Ferrero']|uniref:M23 family metallopeptidase n=1 Tax=Curtobacterium sp. 'Ferrero' TaxID=2033654 RepID=UPI000BCEF1DD|nr:M23 family metallopeptidase [Curtobacterium sp. 'Ferrero']PCN47286.1 hypothetical protein Csp2054_12550 [Curtobacterium sp. 'Ferrero']